MDGAVTNFLQFNETLGYILVFFFLLLEGELIFFIAAFLAHRGFFHPATLLAVTVAGVFIGDLIWFITGRNMHKTSKPFQFVAKHVGKAFEKHVQKNPIRVLFISKFTYGLHRVVLLKIGSMGMPLKDFLRGDFGPSLIWIAVIFILGYISSMTLVPLRSYLRFAEVGLALGVILFAILSYLISRVLRRKL